MPSMKHTHMYFRNKFDKWCCGIPDCSHFMPGNVQEMMPGKKSICWECRREFNLNSFNMRRTRPVCDNCEPAGIGNASIADINAVIEKAEKQIDPLARHQFAGATSTQRVFLTMAVKNNMTAQRLYDMDSSIWESVEQIEEFLKS